MSSTLNEALSILKTKSYNNSACMKESNNPCRHCTPIHTHTPQTRRHFHHLSVVRNPLHPSFPSQQDTSHPPGHRTLHNQLESSNDHKGLILCGIFPGFKVSNTIHPSLCVSACTHSCVCVCTCAHTHHNTHTRSVLAGAYKH